MRLISGLRELVFLRRIARSLESLVESQRTLARLALEDSERQQLERLPRERKPTVVGALDPVEASRRWRREQIASGRWTEEELNDEYGVLPNK